MPLVWRDMQLRVGLVGALLMMMLGGCGDDTQRAVHDGDGEPMPDAPRGEATVRIVIRGAGNVNIDGARCTNVIPCVATFAVGTEIELTPVPGRGAEFQRWDGACSGTHDCVLRLGADTDLIAQFSSGCRDECDQEGLSRCTDARSTQTCGNFDDDVCLEWGPSTACGSSADTCQFGSCYFALSVAPLPLDASMHFGTITSDPPTFRCGETGSDCERSFIEDTVITLTASSDDYATFDGWALFPLSDQTVGKDCVGSTAPCTVKLTQSASLLARYCTSACPLGGVRCSGNTDIIETCGQYDDDRCTEYAEPVTCPSGQLCTASGCAAGAIATASAVGHGHAAIDGVTCDGITCTQGVVAGGTATLTAVPDLDAVFTGWSGACSGTGPCVVAGGESATASFALRCDEETLAETSGTAPLVAMTATSTCLP